MWYLRRVVGESMFPSYRPGQVVLVSHARQFRTGDVVVAFMDNREVMKRITSMRDGKVFLEGDNSDHSTDSKQHGWLQDRHILGRVIWPRKRMPGFDKKHG